MAVPDMRRNVDSYGVREATVEFVCEQCGKRVVRSRRNAGAMRFCSQECQKASIRRDDIVPCTRCHSLLGYGYQKSSKMLGVSKSCVIKARRDNGVAVPSHLRRKSGGRHLEALFNEQYVKAYRREIAAFGDWSRHPAVVNWRDRERYWSLTPGERREKNRKNMAFRKRRLKCPIKYSEYRDRLKKWKERYYTDNPSAKMANNLRSRLAYAMRRQGRRSKDRKTEQYLGCSYEQLALHLEAQFKGKMSWSNYGTAWHIDHIIPCASFDFMDERQIAMCFHWTNMRPLWKRANIRKHARITEPQMALPLPYPV